MVNASPTNIWLVCCWALPGSCGERLFQRLDVGKLDSLSSTPGSDHITLKENKCEGHNEGFKKKKKSLSAVKSYLD